MNVLKKEVTIYDIAQRLNISASTVSRGLKDHPGINSRTRKKIHHTATEMGYRSNSFASNLRKKSSHVIGVIVPRLNSSFMSDVLAGIEKVVNDANYTLFISQSLESMKKEVSNARAMFNNRVDGMLVSLAYDTDSTDHFEPFINRDIPVVFFDRVDDQGKYPGICIDNYKAAYQIVSHFIEQGYKKIAHISGNQLRNVYSERTRGYKQALKDHNIPFADELLIINDLSKKSAIDAANAILRMEDRPDAVFSANDSTAVNCMLALKSAGLKIPGDIAFAGFNNDPISCVIEPNLTTIDYNGYAMGQLAATTMINRLADPNNSSYTQNTVLNAELIIRESSKRKKKNS